MCTCFLLLTIFRNLIYYLNFLKVIVQIRPSFWFMKGLTLICYSLFPFVVLKIICDAT